MKPDFWQLVVTQAWQIAVLTFLVAVLSRTIIRHRPHFAHALWLLVLIKCLTPPLWGHSVGLFSRIQAIATTEPAPSPRVPISSRQGEPADSVSMSAFSSDNDLSAATPEDGGDVARFDHGEVLRWNDEQPAEFPSNGHDAPSRLRAVSWSFVLLICVLMGGFVTLSVMVYRYLHCLHLIERGRTTNWDEMLKLRLRLLAKQLGVRRIPQILVSDVHFGPAVLGVFRHTIVLPKCLLTVRISSIADSVQVPVANMPGSKSTSCLPGRTAAAGGPAIPEATCELQPQETADTAQVAASREIPPGRRELPSAGGTESVSGLPDFLTPILAHELLHLRRGDLFTGVLQAVAQCFWWFHPAVWYTNRWLSREAERCCDEQVIAELGCSPAEYARSLLSVIECKHQLNPVPVFPGMKPVEITSQRMERIMSLKNGLNKRTPVWCWLAVAVLALVVLPGAASSDDAENSQSTQSVTTSVATQAADESISNVEPSLQSALDKNVSLKIQNQSLEEVMASISAEHGLQINIYRNEPQIDPESERTHRRIDYQCENRSLGAAITDIAAQVGLQMTLKQVQIVIQLPSPRSRIRANESFILSNDRTPSPDEVIAYVDEIPIRVCDLAFYPYSYRNAFKSDRNVRVDRRDIYSESESGRSMLLQTLHRQFPRYLTQEVYLKHIRQYLTPGDIAAGASYTTLEDQHILQHQHQRFNTTSDQERDVRLAAEFLSMPLIRKHLQRRSTVQFFKRMLFNGYAYAPFPENDIVDYVETILMQARFRKPVSVKFENADFMTAIDSISAEHDVPIRLVPLHAEMASRLSNPPVTIDIRDQSLEEAVRLIVEPRGMTATLTAEGLSIQHTAPETLTQEFLSASPAAYGIFGLVSKTGWQPLNAEIRLKDAITLAGGVADPANVDVEVCHLKHLKTADGRQRHRILSLRSILEDTSGVHNSTLSDGDVVTLRNDPNAQNQAQLDSLRSPSPVPAESNNVSSPQTDSRNSSVTITYAVADLVVPAGPPEAMPDFSPLVEVLHTTIAPESWKNGGASIAADPRTICLVIRQTRTAHDQISELLSALRKDQGQVVIGCRVVKITTDLLWKGLEERCSLYSRSDGQRWALLTPLRHDGISQFLAAQNAGTHWSLSVAAISGQQASIEMDAVDQSDPVRFRLSASAHVVAASEVIRLNYSVSISDAEKNIDAVAAAESLVGSGQTLLLVIEKPITGKAAENVDRYAVFLTPSKVVEEEEHVVPDNSSVPWPGR